MRRWGGKRPIWEEIGTMAVSIIVVLAAIFLGTFLNRRFFTRKPQPLLLLGGGLFLMGLAGSYASRFHLFPRLEDASLFVSMLGVPFLSEGIWWVSHRNKG